MLTLILTSKQNFHNQNKFLIGYLSGQRNPIGKFEMVSLFQELIDGNFAVPAWFVYTLFV